MEKVILIIEDNEMNMTLIRDILEFSDYKTIECYTAEDGISQAREKLTDLIIMDIQLPGMSGNDAMVILRGDDRTSGIPCIAVTASIMAQDKQEILSAGFDGYHEKPIEHKQLIVLINQLTGRDEKGA